MKRYLLFTFAEGSFNNGWDAFEDDFDDAQEAADAGRRAVAGGNIGDPEEWEVVDTDVKQVILSGVTADEPRHDTTITAAELAKAPGMRPINVRVCWSPRGL